MTRPKAISIMLENRLFFDKLPDDQAGKLIKSLFEFCENGALPDYAEEFSPLGFAWQAVAGQVARSNQLYVQKCERNSEIAKEREQRKRQQSENTNVHECSRTYTDVHEPHQSKVKSESEMKSTMKSKSTNKSEEKLKEGLGGNEEKPTPQNSESEIQQNSDSANRLDRDRERLNEIRAELLNTLK